MELAAQSADNRSKLKQKIVMVVDDKKDARKLLFDRFKELGVGTVRRKKSGREALKYLETNRVDCIALDISMKDDGIETAARIQKQSPQTPIFFSTAYDTEDNRKRSADKGVRVFRWVDKNENWLANASSAVSDSLLQPDKSDFQNSLVESLRDENPDVASSAAAKEAIETLPLINPVQGEAAQPETANPSTLAQNSAVDFPGVLGLLRVAYEEVLVRQKDVAGRHIAWEQFRKIVKEQLWAACERLADDRYRLQLADQLDLAIKGIEPHQLQSGHLKAIALVLEKLSSEKIGPRDVHDVEKSWRAAKVETLPSLGEILRNVDKFYR